MRRHGPVVAALLAAVAWVYAGVPGHAFLDYDDLVYLADAAEGLSPEMLWRALTTAHFSNWIPLTRLSLALDASLYGRNPTGFLWTNVALHAVATLGLYAALVRATGARGRSAVVAAVFAVHPLHVESVAWVSQRKDVLSGVLFAATLGAYVGYARRPAAGRLALVTTLFALGLLAKPMLVTVPCVLLLLDVWPLARAPWPGAAGRAPWRRLVLEKTPLFALAAVASAITYRVQAATPAMAHGEALPFPLRAANAVDALAAYVADAFWPTGLAAFYPHPQDGLGAGVVAAEALALAAATAALALAARRHPAPLVGWLWFAGMLVPVLGLVQVGMQARADRYTYLPLVGLAIAAVWGAVALSARLPRPARRALGVAAGVALAALAVAAREQVAYWRDSRAVFARAVAVTRDNYFAEHGLGRALRREGHLDEAARHLERAVSLRPGWVKARVELAEVLAERGETERAALHYRRALELAPDDVRNLVNLGQVLLRAGRPREALAPLHRARDALARGARLPAAFRASLHFALARAELAAGDLAAASRALEAAEPLRPGDPRTAALRGRLGLAQLAAGDAEAARRSLGLALERGVDGPDLREGLAAAALASGHPREAAEHYRAALARDPGRVSAANNLAWLLATDPAVRDAAEAVRWAERAAAAPEAPAVVLDTLAAAYAAAGRFEEAVDAATRARDRAREDGEDALARAIEDRLARYRAGRGPAETAPARE